MFFLHCGTPCNTFTAARKDDGGPPPLRSQTCPMGLSDLKEFDQWLVLLGNLFLFRTVEACVAVFDRGGNFSIENPLLSLMWGTHIVKSLINKCRAFSLDFDQCAFGAPSKKPTRFLCSTDLLDDIVLSCPGNHYHVTLKGIFKTKLAQIYPWALCASVAIPIAQLWADPLAQFARSFALTTPKQDRKRQLGFGKLWQGHKQSGTAFKAQWAGYQLKRGSAKPLFELELEPGEAIRGALSVTHPFTVPVPLDPAPLVLWSICRIRLEA